MADILDAVVRDMFVSIREKRAEKRQIARQQRRQVVKTVSDREKFLSNPTKPAKLMADAMAGFLDDDSLDKLSRTKSLGQAPDRFIENFLPEDHPFRGATSAAKERIGSVIARNPLVSGSDATRVAFSEEISSRLEDAYKYKFKEESSFFGSGWFGDAVGELPGYDEWKEAYKEAHSKGLRGKDLAVSAAMGAGFHYGVAGAQHGLYKAAGDVAFKSAVQAGRMKTLKHTIKAGVKGGGKRVLAKGVGGGLARLAAGSLAAPIPGGRVVAAGAGVAAAGWAAFDLASQALSHTEWAMAREGSPKVLLADMALGLPAGVAAEVVARKIGSKIFGTAAKQIGTEGIVAPRDVPVTRRNPTRLGEITPFARDERFGFQSTDEILAMMKEAKPKPKQRVSKKTKKAQKASEQVVKDAGEAAAAKEEVIKTEAAATQQPTMENISAHDAAVKRALEADAKLTKSSEEIGKHIEKSNNTKRVETLSGETTSPKTAAELNALDDVAIEEVLVETGNPTKEAVEQAAKETIEDVADQVIAQKGIDPLTATVEDLAQNGLKIIKGTKNRKGKWQLMQKGENGKYATQRYFDSYEEAVQASREVLAYSLRKTPVEAAAEKATSRMKARIINNQMPEDTIAQHGLALNKKKTPVYKSFLTEEPTRTKDGLYISGLKDTELGTDPILAGASMETRKGTVTAEGETAEWLLSKGQILSNEGSPLTPVTYTFAPPTASKRLTGQLKVEGNEFLFETAFGKWIPLSKMSDRNINALLPTLKDLFSASGVGHKGDITAEFVRQIARGEKPGFFKKASTTIGEYVDSIIPQEIARYDTNMSLAKWKRLQSQGNPSVPDVGGHVLRAKGSTLKRNIELGEIYEQAAAEASLDDIFATARASKTRDSQWPYATGHQIEASRTPPAGARGPEIDPTPLSILSKPDRDYIYSLGTALGTWKKKAENLLDQFKRRMRLTEDVAHFISGSMFRDPVFIGAKSKFGFHFGSLKHASRTSKDPVMGLVHIQKVLSIKDGAKINWNDPKSIIEGLKRTGKFNQDDLLEMQGLVTGAIEERLMIPRNRRIINGAVHIPDATGEYIPLADLSRKEVAKIMNKTGGKQVEHVRIVHAPVSLMKDGRKKYMSDRAKVQQIKDFLIKENYDSVMWKDKGEVVGAVLGEHQVADMKSFVRYHGEARELSRDFDLLIHYSPEHKAKVHELASSITMKRVGKRFHQANEREQVRAWTIAKQRIKEDITARPGGVREELKIAKLEDAIGRWDVETVEKLTLEADKAIERTVKKEGIDREDLLERYLKTLEYTSKQINRIEVKRRARGKTKKRTELAHETEVITPRIQKHIAKGTISRMVNKNGKKETPISYIKRILGADSIKTITKQEKDIKGLQTALESLKIGTPTYKSTKRALTKKRLARKKSVRKKIFQIEGIRDRLERRVTTKSEAELNIGYNAILDWFSKGGQKGAKLHSLEDIQTAQALVRREIALAKNSKNITREQHNRVKREIQKARERQELAMLEKSSRATLGEGHPQYVQANNEVRRLISQMTKEGFTIEEMQSAYASHSARQVAGLGIDRRFLSLALLATAVPPAVIMGPALLPGNIDTAEASLVQGTLNILKGTGKAVAEKMSSEEVAKLMVNEGYAGIKGGIKHNVENYAKQVKVAAGEIKVKTKDQLDSIYRKIAKNRFLSPHVRGDALYQEGSNPHVHLASTIGTAAKNAELDRALVAEAMSEVPGLKIGSMRTVSSRMEPIARAYAEPLRKTAFHRAEIERLEGEIARTVTKKMEKNPAKYSREWEVVKEHKAALKEHQDGLKSFEGIVDQYKAESFKAFEELSKEFPEVRIFLAAEDDAYNIYPFLKGRLNSYEEAAVGRIKNINRRIAAEMESVGEAPIKARSFMPHVSHPKVNFGAIDERVFGDMTTQAAQDKAKLAHFHHRRIDSMPMMPHVGYSMERYLPDAHKRIELNKFWDFNNPNGWNAHAKKMIDTGSEEMRSYWIDTMSSFAPEPATIANKIARQMYLFDATRILFLSPSVAFKHLLKQTGTLAVMGPQVMKHWGKAASVSFKTGMHDLGMMLPEGSVKEMLTRIPQGNAGELYKTLTVMGKHTNIINDLTMGYVPEGWFEKGLQSISRFGSIPVQMIENFDRGVTVLAGLEAAAKKGIGRGGVTPDQALYGVYETILKTNFLGGIQNPEWLRNPKIRALAMFQSTPAKIMEERAIRAAKTVVDVKRAARNYVDDAIAQYGEDDARRLILANMDGPMETLRGLSMLARDVSKGELEFRMSVLKDSLTHTKDSFGTPVSKQFVRNVISLGGLTMGTEKAFDINLLDHVVHPPFFHIQGGKAEFRLNPALNAGLEAWHRKATGESDYWMADFMRKYLMTDNYMVSTLNKAMRLSKDDIPKVYSNSKFQYFFGIPSAGAKH